MKTKLAILIMFLFSIAINAHGQAAIVNDPANLFFQKTKWATESKQLIQNYNELKKMKETLDKGAELYEKIDAVIQQSVYLKENFEYQLEAVKIATDFLKKDPKQIANPKTYEEYGSIITQTLRSINQLGEMVNLIITPKSKMTTSERLTQLRDINKELKDDYTLINNAYSSFESRNRYQLAFKDLKKPLQ